MLVDGVWHDRWYDTKKTGGKFVRSESAFRNWVTPDGSPGPSGEGGYKAEAGRYHLYVSLACPWAHRALIFRKLKGLDSMISVSVVHPEMLENGWAFGDYPGATGDHLFGSEYLHQIYTKAKHDYSGRVTVPVLWDKERGTIVNNESSEIIRMLNSAFDGVTDNRLDFFPQALRTEIEAINQPIYDHVNNGVYKAGFATTQGAYEEAVTALFANLDQLDKRLGNHRYLVGNRLTEADWRLFTTLVRFDPVYVGHFKCNLKRIADYEHLGAYLRELYQFPGIEETVNLDHIQRHYYFSHDTINPTRIIPAGPALNWDTQHNRDRFPADNLS